MVPNIQGSDRQMQRFHSEDYVDFLKRISPDNMKHYSTQMQKFNVGEYTDCPVFDGLYNFCATYTGKKTQQKYELKYYYYLQTSNQFMLFFI